MFFLFNLCHSPLPSFSLRTNTQCMHAYVHIYTPELKQRAQIYPQCSKSTRFLTFRPNVYGLVIKICEKEIINPA